jgi:carbon-monoxide dehydrogenase medium subunit
MNRFEYCEPATFDDTFSLLRRYNGLASVLAGGTDLLVEIKEHLRRPEYIINIKKIPGMRHLHFSDACGLRFGSLVTAREIETSPVVQRMYPGLLQAVRELGSIQIRNRATVAGNVCRASPSADTLPPLIAGGAALTIRGPASERVVALEEFFTGPGQTVLRSDELVTEILVPPPPPHTGGVYIKHGRRRAMELATVGVAVSLTLDGEICSHVRIVLGAVAPTPVRAKAAELALVGQTLEDRLIRVAANDAMTEARPISDVRGSAEYRREMVRVLTERALKQAAELAR